MATSRGFCKELAALHKIGRISIGKHFHGSSSNEIKMCQEIRNTNFFKPYAVLCEVQI
jgi:hypothetical protein